MSTKDVTGQYIQFSHNHKRIVHSMMEQMDLSFGQLPIMEIVKENNGCSQKEIADKFHVSKPSITNSIKRLEKKGYVTKEVDPRDTRYSIIKITPEGEKITHKAREFFDELDNLVYTGISDEEKEFMYRILSKMNENIKEMANNVEDNS